MYYRNAQAAVVVYDVTKATSLEKAKSWVKELQRQANPNIVIALAGNKVDLVQTSAVSSGSTPSSESEDEADDATATPGESPSAGGDEPESLRQVPREEAQAYATEAGLLFFETSAKTGEGVVEIFTEIGTPTALDMELPFKIKFSEENTDRAHSGFHTRWCRSIRWCRRTNWWGQRGCEPRGATVQERRMQLLSVALIIWTAHLRPSRPSRFYLLAHLLFPSLCHLRGHAFICNLLL